MRHGVQQTSESAGTGARADRAEFRGDGARGVAVLTVASVLYFLLPREGRAEGQANYKFQSWQEDAGRVRVDAHYGSLEQTFSNEAKLKLIGLIDTITGATPTGQLPTLPDDPLPLANITEERKAWQVEASKPFGRVTVTAGYANSREGDYLSDGFSLNTNTDFNRKNTNVLVGVAATRDDVRVFYQTPWEKKHTLDQIVGVTQLLDPATSLTFNLSHGRASGYLSDPYKLIQKHVEVGPGLVLLRNFGDSRPDERNKWIVYTSVNRTLAGLGAAVEASYRFHDDDFGITSHTVSVEWFQKFWNDRLIVRPAVRWYDQSAADFYYTTLDGTAITPTSTTPNPTGPFYSADYRLSDLATLNLGLKVIWSVVPDRFTVDLAYERYLMQGQDDVTHRDAYADADVFTVGARFSW